MNQLLFSGNYQSFSHPKKKFFESKRAFDKAIYKIAGDKANELFHSKNSCTYQDLRIGEYCFCKAMKVDLAESEDNCLTNQTRLQKIKSTISSTMYLLHSLFENFGCIAKLHKEIGEGKYREIFFAPKKLSFQWTRGM